jgi:hypothetical protein
LGSGTIFGRSANRLTQRMIDVFRSSCLKIFFPQIPAINRSSAGIEDHYASPTGRNNAE